MRAQAATRTGTREPEHVIATRYERRAIYFLAVLYLASAMIWMR